MTAAPRNFRGAVVFRTYTPVDMRRLPTPPAAGAGGAGPPDRGRTPRTPLKLKPKNDQGPLGDEKLSNERTVTRWGHTNLLGGIREEPSMSSKSIGKLRWNTEDGLPEVYLVLESRWTTTATSG